MSLNIIPSRAIHVVTNGNALFFGSGIYEPYGHCSIIYNRQDVRAAQVPTGRPVDGGAVVPLLLISVTVLTHFF